MGWSGFRFRDRRVKVLLTAVLIGLLVALLSDKGNGFSGDSWVIWFVIFAALPAISGRRGRRSRRWRDDDEDEEDEFEKPKRDFEKPKREPRYVLGDDGEITEASEDQPLDEAEEDSNKTLYI